VNLPHRPGISLTIYPINGIFEGKGNMRNIPKIACPERNSATAYRIINNEAVILHLDSGIYYSLNEVGARIWDLCDGNSNIGNITEIICDEFEVSKEIALRDILEVLSDLLQEKLITVHENSE
jgi:hypothetical protein